MKFKKSIKISIEDWEILRTALFTFYLEPFQSSSLQWKVKNILDKIK